MNDIDTYTIVRINAIIKPSFWDWTLPEVNNHYSTHKRNHKASRKLTLGSHWPGRHTEMMTRNIVLTKNRGYYSFNILINFILITDFWIIMKSLSSCPKYKNSNWSHGLGNSFLIRLACEKTNLLSGESTNMATRIKLHVYNAYRVLHLFIFHRPYGILPPVYDMWWRFSIAKKCHTMLAGCL